MLRVASKGLAGFVFVSFERCVLENVTQVGETTDPHLMIYCRYLRKICMAHRSCCQGGNRTICMIYNTILGLDMYSIDTDPAQQLIVADIGSTVDGLDDVDRHLSVV